MKKMQVVIVTLCAVFVMGIALDIQAASIGNTVWNDRNANSFQDEGEEGIPNVKIKLYNGNDVETDRTNSQGRYKFKDLDDGHYTIVVAQETLPEGCVNTHDRDGNNDNKYEDKWVAGDDYWTHADFGYHCTATNVVAVGQVSPATGPSTMVVILATAIAIGTAMLVYNKQNKKTTLKK